MHLAAESHVDRSIDGPAEFIQTNVIGTFSLLEEARAYWMALPADERAAFRQLLKISGIGARTALAVLSGMSVAELAQAVALQAAQAVVLRAAQAVAPS